jgi:hypothetical protein
MADGTLKVGTIITSSGSGTITLGQSGETISVPAGVTTSGLGKIRKITVNDDIAVGYSGLTSGTQTFTAFNVTHTALSTSNKLAFFINIPYFYKSGTNIGMTQLYLNDGSSDVTPSLFYWYVSGDGTGEGPPINASYFNLTPASTSAITYTCRGVLYRPSGSSTITIGESTYGKSRLMCMEYGDYE